MYYLIKKPKVQLFAELQQVLKDYDKKNMLAVVCIEIFTTFASALRNRCRESEARYVAFC